MNREQVAAQVKQILGEKIIAFHQKSDRRIFLEVQSGDILEVTRILFHDLKARFHIASGVDTPEGIEILYHWAFDACNCVLTVRTKLDRNKPEIESCAPLYKAMEWIEREMWELLGIQFKNHPDLRHLLLKDDWPAGKYPLRRDYLPEAANGQKINLPADEAKNE
ncbi:NADH-quinone oxidoreductase subunit C [candidate division FCPU426 bacterium]|nr:NADH-quinone oxidoreductase subunit C [candidate division FCPU426 bacterium]